MGIQKQIDNLKSKLQETQDRRKRQEDLIMKVENLALKVRALVGSLQVSWLALACHHIQQTGKCFCPGKARGLCLLG